MCRSVRLAPVHRLVTPTAAAIPDLMRRSAPMGTKPPYVVMAEILKEFDATLWTLEHSRMAKAKEVDADSQKHHHGERVRPAKRQ